MPRLLALLRLLGDLPDNRVGLAAWGHIVGIVGASVRSSVKHQASDVDSAKRALHEAASASAADPEVAERLDKLEAMDTQLEALKTTLEETQRIARRVFGGAHPLTEGIEDSLRQVCEIRELRSERAKNN